MLSCRLRPLQARGTKIVTAETSEPVRLRGVNRSGLEYSAPVYPGPLASAGISESEFDEIASWGANLVRIPFNQSWALRTSEYDPGAYLAALDQVIVLAAKRNAYTMLDLQWLDAAFPRGWLPNGRVNFVPPLPNLGSIELWRQLAFRYRGEPAVLFDIFNEPHDPLPGDTGDFNGIRSDAALVPIRRRRVTSAEWQPWAIQLVSAIRSEHPSALIFVSGVDWGYDLERLPCPDLEGVVYSSHVYPKKEKPWQSAFGNLSAQVPVFIAEWGGLEEDLSWGRELAGYLEDRDLGWAAWSWSDHPRLVQPGSHEPTAFGSLVREILRG